MRPFVAKEVPVPRTVQWGLAAALTLIPFNHPVHAAPLEALALRADDLEAQVWLPPSGQEEGTFTVAQMRTSKEAVRQVPQQDVSAARVRQNLAVSMLTMLATPGVVASGAYLLSPEPARIFPMALGAFVLPLAFYVASEVNSALPPSAKLKSPWDNYLIVGFMAASMVGYPAYEVYDAYRLRQGAGLTP